MRTALNKKGLLGRQTHLLRRLHQDRMANEFVYTITIGHRLSSINDNREKCLPCPASSWCGNIGEIENDPTGFRNERAILQLC